MRIVEEHCWDAIAELLPAQGRDFLVDIKVPEDESVYKADVKITALTELGAALASFIAKRLNKEMCTKLAGSKSFPTQEESENFVKQIMSAKIVNVEVVDNSTPSVPSEEPIRVEEPKQETKPVNPEPDNTIKLKSKQDELLEKFDVKTAHWSGIFKAYLPNPDLNVFLGWIQKLILVEINRRLVTNGVKSLPLPEKFDEEWLNHVKTVVSNYALYYRDGYTALFQPRQFAELIDNLYIQLEEAIKRQPIYNGTARVLFSLVGLNELAVKFMYLSTEDNQ